MARPREFDEQKVLRAAAGVFRRNGYAGTSLEELTAATGLGKGSLYGAFGSKHGLYLAALDEYARRNVSASRRAIEGSEERSPTQDLGDYLAGVVEGSTDGTPNCMLTSAAAELSDHDVPVARRVGAAFEDLAASMHSTVERAQAAGEISPGADPQAVADLLLAVARGIDVLGQAGMARERLDGALGAAFAALAAQQSEIAA